MKNELLVNRIGSRASDYDHVVIAMSGGVDSGLVAWAAHVAVGSRAVAVTVHSEFIASREFSRAVEVAEAIGMEHHPLPLRMLEDKLIRRNIEDRCYHCKRMIFSMMASEYGDDSLILDGTTAADDPARPGMRAALEVGVMSPLVDMGWTKEQIRCAAKAVGLPNWDVPSESCLATRIPYGIPLSSMALDRVGAMESFWHKRGVKTLRMTHDNLVATVQVLPQYTAIVENNGDNFVRLVEKIGLRSWRLEVWNP